MRERERRVGGAALYVVAILLVLAACATPTDPKVTGDTTGGTCTPKSSRCQGANLEVCADDGTGYATVTCPNGCQNNQCITDACVPNEKKCVSTQLWSCGSDSKWSIEDCANGCQDNKCKPAAVCTPSQRECQPNKLRVCNADGQWVETTCELGCENGQCKLPQCTYGEKKCETTQLYVCKEDRTWQVTDCQYGCGNNACLAPACEVGEKRCSPTNAKQPQVCNAGRTAFVDDGPACTQYCNGGACQQAACQSGETRCSLDKKTLQTCNSTQTGWDVTQTCTDGCVLNASSKAVCALCPTGGKRCNQGAPEVCDPAKGWTAGTACNTDSICVNDGCYYQVLLDFSDMNENYNELAYYMSWCWKTYGPGNSDTMCFAIDSTQLPQTITYDALRDWFCKGVDGGAVTKANFASTTPGDDGSALFAAAEDMFGCTGITNAINFSIETSSGDLPKATNGTYCMYLDATLINEVFLDECKDYPGN